MNISPFSILCIALSVLVHTSVIGQDGTIVGLPHSLTVHEGQEFEVYYMVDPGSEPVAAIDFMVHYDTHYLTALAIEKVDSPLNLNQVEPKIDHEIGSILYAAFKLQHPWPTSPFTLVKIRFLALEEIPQTFVSHKLEENPRTLMAYAGKNTLKFAPDLTVRILDQIENNTPENTIDVPQLNVACDSHHTPCIISFEIPETRSAELTLTNTNKNWSISIFNNICQPGNTYTFEVDPSILDTTQYQVKLKTNGSSRSIPFNVAKEQ